MEDGGSHDLLKSLIAGGLAGMAGKSVVAPLDRIKILMQTQNVKYRQLGILESLGRILRDDGVGGLFRGNGVQMLRIFPYGAIQFASYESFKKLFDREQSSTNTTGRHWRKFVAGALAGTCGVTATFPLDTLRARLAFHSKSEEGYRGLGQTLRTIMSQEGGRGLYRGLMPSIIAIIPNSGLTFFYFETLKSWLLKNIPFFRELPEPTSRHQTEEEREARYSLTSCGKLLAGGLAGALAQSVSYPLDVARRRMQLGQGNGLLQVLVDTYRNDGIAKGLFRGMTVNYVRAVPMSAVSLSCYEIIKQRLGLSTSIKLSVS